MQRNRTSHHYVKCPCMFHVTVARVLALARMKVASLGSTLQHLRREVFVIFHALLIAMAAAFLDKTVTEDPDIPIFLPRPNNVTYHLGDTAMLPCAVENVGTKTIIWRRASDPHPLTIGQMIYVNDDRYSIQSIPERREWNLLIKNIQRSDDGVYECQVSSRYKLIHHIMLRVNMTDRPEREHYDNFKKDNLPVSAHSPPPVDNPPVIYISGTKFVEKGDSIHLVCNASGRNYPPEDLDWFKDGIKISADGVRHITIDKFRVQSTKTLVSVFDKKYSEMSDSGTYVCRSSNMGITSIKVHVLNAGSTNVRRGTSASSGNMTRSSGQSHFRSSRPILVASLLFTHAVTQTLFGKLCG